MVTQNDFFFTIATGRMGFSSPFELVNLRIYCIPWSPYSLCKTESFKIPLFAEVTIAVAAGFISKLPQILYKILSYRFWSFVNQKRSKFYSTL